MVDKFYVETYKQVTPGQFTVASRDVFEDVVNAKEKIVALIRAGVGEKDVVCYVTREMPFHIRTRIEVEFED